MATVYWVGRALPTARHERLTFSGSWSTGQTITLTINTRSIVVTLGTGTSLAQVATAVANAWRGDPAGTNETRSETGNNIPEFSEVECTADTLNARVDLVAKKKGKPFTLTTSETGGTITQSVVVAGTGPNYASDANNWARPTAPGLPQDGDDVTFRDSDIDLLWDLAALTAVSPLSLKFEQSYSGRVGLPSINRDDPGNPYTEYRPTFFEMGQASDAQNTSIEIGRGPGVGSPRINLDFGDARYSLIVYQTGVSQEQGIRAVQIKSTQGSSSATILSGDVYFAAGGHLNELIVGSTGDALPADVECGLGVDLANATVRVHSGRLAICTEVSTTPGTIQVYGGELFILAGLHAAIPLTFRDIDVFGGTLYPGGFGIITSLAVQGEGVVDFERSAGSYTVTSCFLWEGASFFNNFKRVTFSNPVSVIGDINKMRLRLGANATLTIA